jgi:hypothetical protein
MLTRLFPGFAVALALTFGSAANAYTFDGSSLHGATGELTITDTGPDYSVVWSIDLTNFDDADAVATGHTLLTHVAFKAFTSISSVELDDPTVGNLAFPSNVSNAGCAASSPAGFVCVTLASPVLATAGGTYDVSFTVVGVLNEGEVSYRGKFGPRNGWVISESFVIPEPSAALIFGAGLLLVRTRIRR